MARITLKDIAKENTNTEEFIEKIEKLNQKSEKRKYYKLGISIPEQLHEHLLDESRDRRRKGDKYTLSHIIAEAVKNTYGE